MKILLAAFLGLVLTSSSFATTYYISATDGIDNFAAPNGRAAATPWRTIDMLIKAHNNLITFGPGDQILLKRGNTFSGGMATFDATWLAGAAGSPVLISTYGTPTDPRPILKGDFEPDPDPSGTHGGDRFIWKAVSTIGVTGQPDCYYMDLVPNAVTAGGTQCRPRTPSNVFMGPTWLAGVTFTGTLPDLWAANGSANLIAATNTMCNALTTNQWGPYNVATRRLFIKLAPGSATPQYPPLPHAGPPAASEVRVFGENQSILQITGNHAIIEDLDLREGLATGCAVSSGSSVTADYIIRRLNVQDCGSQGISCVGGGITSAMGNISVLDCTVKDIINVGIYLQNVKGGLVAGNDVSRVRNSLPNTGLVWHANDENMIEFESIWNVVVENNYFHDQGPMTGTYGVNFGENKLFVCDGGDSIYNCDNVTFRYNTCINVYWANWFGKSLNFYGNILRIRSDTLSASSVALSVNTNLTGTPYSGVKCYVYNNVFYGGHEQLKADGINYWPSYTLQLSGAPSTTMFYAYNNILCAPTGHGTHKFGVLNITNPTSVYSDYNCYYDVDASPVTNFPFTTDNGGTYPTGLTNLQNVTGAGGLKLDTHSIAANPLLLNATTLYSAADDFRPGATSPCLDVGKHLKINAALGTTDWFAAMDWLTAGNPNPNTPNNKVVRKVLYDGLAPDMGAYDVAGAGTTTLNSGLQFSAHFDEQALTATKPTVIDASGFNQHGVPSAGVTPVAVGKINGSANFDGVASGGVIDSTNLNSWYPSTFTVGFWFKPGGVGTSGINPWIINGKLLVRYLTTANTVQFTVTTNATASVATTAPLTNGVWYNVVCTYNDAGDRIARIYINNGAAVAGVAATGTLTNGAASVIRIGQAGASGYLKGQLDELNLWNRVLTGTEITALYNANLGAEVKGVSTYAILDKSSPNFLQTTISNYGAVTGATATPQDKGVTVSLTNNGWKSVPYVYTVTAGTILSFDFKSTVQGDIHAIGLDTDGTQDATHTIQLYGTTTSGVQTYRTYDKVNGGEWQHYDIPIGTLSGYTGAMTKLFFGNQTAGGTGTSQFSNIVVK